MASRPELREICRELDIDSEGLSIADMKAAIRKEADRRWGKKRQSRSYSADNLSVALKKFLTCEYSFKIRDKEKNIIDMSRE